MRYDKAKNLLHLALLLAGSHYGLSLDEMANRLGVSRRTVERMRDALTELFPNLECHDDDAPTLRWRLPVGSLTGLIQVPAATLTALETTAEELQSRGEADRSALLRDALAKLRVMMRPDLALRTETDVAALMQAEGIAMRPGPRPVIMPGLLPILRHAILAMQQVEILHAAPEAEAPVRYVLCPHGLLHGGRGWLVAHDVDWSEMRLWRLDRIASASLLPKSFTPVEGFTLAGYAKNAFGVFQEPPQDVVLRFSPEVAGDAEGWSFHPLQTSAREPDGALTVRFRAGGMQEMCAHLFTWGSAVTILAPDELRTELRRMASRAARHHR